MVAQKCKNIWFQATLKEFSSSANPNVRNSILSKLLLLQDHTE